jgi:DNA-binding NarL/FixJ family response regulator
MDLRMSGMSGLDAIRAINLRPDPPRILVLTSFDAEEDIYQSVGAGAQGYILIDLAAGRILLALGAAFEEIILKKTQPSARLMRFQSDNCFVVRPSM